MAKIWVNDIRRYLQALLTDDGTLFGSADMTVDGSITPVPFFFECPPDRKAEIRRIGILIRDAQNTFRWDKFGGQPAIQNGLSSSITLKGIEYLIAASINTNAEFDFVGTRMTYLTDGAGDDFASFHLDFTLNSSLNRGLILGEGDTFKLIVNDDLTPHIRIRSFVAGNYF